MKYTRVSRLEEKRTKKQFLIVLIGIVALLLIIFTVGIPFIVGASVFLGNLKSNQPIVTSNDTTVPVPPTLTSDFSATNSAQIKIEGYGEPESSLSLLVNGEQVKNILLPADGSFSFNDIPLQEGENTLLATVTDTAGNESVPSRELHVEYKKGSPKLEINEPEDNQTFAKSQQEIQIKGITDPGVDVRINDRFVAVKDDGSFTFTVKLQDGENTLIIIARDSAGNETRLERKVNYQP